MSYRFRSGWQRCMSVGMGMLTVLALMLGGCPNPDGGGNGNGDGTLEGSWAGDVVYTVTLLTGGSAGNDYSFTRAATVTFSADGQPDTIDLTVGNGEEVFLLPTDELREVGDQAQFMFEGTNGNTGQVTTTTINATVTSITRSDTAFAIGLDLSIQFTGANSGSLSGSYTLQAQVQQDGTLSWTGTTELAFDETELDLGIRVATEGTLTKQ